MLQNWAFQHDQGKFIAGLKTTINRIPRTLRGNAVELIYNADREQDYKSNITALRAVSGAAAKAAKKGKYLSEFKIPQKVIASKDQTKKLAGELAQQCFADMLEIADSLPPGTPYIDSLTATYDGVCRLSLQRIPQVTPPLYGQDQEPEVMECALLRLHCAKWWNRKLQKLRKQHLETLEIMAGAVGRDASPYASHRAIAEFIRDKAAQRRWAESLVLTNENGDQLDLIKAIDASIANPENARAELMKRIRGLEEYAEEIGYQAVFITVSAPSKYHANSKKWNGATPTETNAYMVKTWSQARAKLNRAGASYFGFRVAEPHKDATPHWHMLFFVPADEIKFLCRVIRYYFCRADIAELMDRFKRRKQLRKQWRFARKMWGFHKKAGRKVAEPRKTYLPFQPRFDVEVIDPAKGSAAAYIAKYVSKNINGFEVADLIDSETGKTLGDGVMNVKTWASTWNIRQFQFQGCDPITAYREIRRVREAFTGEHQQELEQLRQAAESNDFVNFIRAMKQIDTAIEYETIPYGNEYGEAVRKLKGVTAGNQTAITRLHQWQMQRRDALKDGAAIKSWTCGTNCTQYGESQKPDQKLEKLGIDSEALALLHRGCTVNISGARYKIRHGGLELLGYAEKPPAQAAPEPSKPQQKVIPLWH